MFWREREKEMSNDQNGGPPCGQVRVLVVGDSGVGKTSLVNLIVKGTTTKQPPQTIGCRVHVKIALNLTRTGSSSLSFGIFLDMTVIQIAVPFFTLKSMASSLYTIFLREGQKRV